MLSVLLTLYSMSIDPDTVPGGWKSISVDSEQIKHIKPWLDRNLPHLFPEIEQKGYEIGSAKMQIVNGMNIQLFIKTTTSLSFEITLYVDHQDKITISEIRRPLGTRPTMGGFNWIHSVSFPAHDFARLIRTIQEKANLLVAKSGTVLVYRKQVVKGIKEHVIFRDANQNVFSAVIIRRPYSLTDELISVYQIY